MLYGWLALGHVVMSAAELQNYFQFTSPLLPQIAWLRFGFVAMSTCVAQVRSTGGNHLSYKSTVASMLQWFVLTEPQGCEVSAAGYVQNLCVDIVKSDDDCSMPPPRCL